ncbi:hypothetical protein JTB14_024666 [Gonioctena quinquepunctata]|nr:hypothetical protein JTB14_024666 [Gonioctena quinquepunctata]
MDEILNNNIQNDNIDPAGHLATNAFGADTSVDIEIIDVAVKNNYLCDQNNPTIGSIEVEANNTKKSNKTDLEAENDTLLEKNQSQLEEANVEDARILRQQKENDSIDATSSNSLPFNVTRRISTDGSEEEKNASNIPEPSVNNHKNSRLEKVTRRILTDGSEAEENASNIPEPSVNNPKNSRLKRLHELQKDRAFVSVMLRSGNNWNCPMEKDALWELKRREGARSRSAAFRKSPYVYFDQLQFLRYTIVNDISEGSMDKTGIAETSPESGSVPTRSLVSKEKKTSDYDNLVELLRGSIAVREEREKNR